MIFIFIAETEDSALVTLSLAKKLYNVTEKQISKNLTQEKTMLDFWRFCSFLLLLPIEAYFTKIFFPFLM